MKTNHATQLASLALFAVACVGCSPDTELTGSVTNLNATSAPLATATQTDAAPSSLAEQLAARAKESAAKAPAERKKHFKAGIDIVRASGIEKSAKQVGDSALDGELMGWDGKTVTLSDLWADGPIILMWYRGGWCPYCNIQLRAMQQSLDKIENAGARLVVLTPELPEKAKETADANDIDIVALHDRDNQLAKRYGIMFDLPDPIVPIYRDKLKLPSYNGTDKLQLPLAATYVINTAGEITYAFLDADYKKRAEPAEVIAAVKALAK